MLIYKFVLTLVDDWCVLNVILAVIFLLFFLFAKSHGQFRHSWVLNKKYFMHWSGIILIWFDLIWNTVSRPGVYKLMFWNWAKPEKIKRYQMFWCKASKYITSAPFYKHGLTLIPTWISNRFHNKIRDEINYPFPNFNGWIIEMRKWISNFTTQYTMDVITYIAMPGLKFIQIKMEPYVCSYNCSVLSKD